MYIQNNYIFHLYVDYNMYLQVPDNILDVEYITKQTRKLGNGIFNYP